MSETVEIKAKARNGVGKGAAREIRRQGQVPGVIYGDKRPPEPITLEFNEFLRITNRGNFLSTVFDIDMDGTKTRVIPRDLQVDPVRDFPLHVDFLRIAKGAKIAVDVAVHFLNDEASPGLKRGGVLNIVRHEVELSCPADAIPDAIEVDLTGLEIGDSIHISDIKLPEGSEPTITDRDFTVATIAGRAAETEAAEDEEDEAADEGAAPDAAEPEEKKEDEE